MKLKLYPDREGFREHTRHGNVIPVFMEILADMETPVSTMAKIRRGNGRGPLFLLESVEGGERWGRYSFLGASAHREIKVFRENIDLEGPGLRREIPHHGDPFGLLRSLLQAYQPVSIPQLPRFWGGYGRLLEL